jgi:small subunit ribosomal protein S21
VLYNEKKENKVGRKAHRDSEISLSVNPNWDIEKTLRIFKNRVSKSGLFGELKRRRAYEKPSETHKRKQRESLKRIRIAERKRQKKRK